jgi:uncharacterized lipoprotein YbaY/heat shock protein HslJ
MRLPFLLALFASIAFAPAGPIGRAAAAEVSGSVTYRDRALLPPDATLTVTLADVSRADAAAEVLATAEMQTRGAPPYPFRLAYDPARVDDRNSYAVSARVTLGDRLMMVSDSHHPVITRGAPVSDVEVILRRVSSGAAPAEEAASQTPNALGLRLPASFTGTLPAASGPGIDWHLDMWPDQVFHLRQDYGEGRAPADDIGRWHADPARDAIVLQGGREAPLFLGVTGNGNLRLRDREGRPIESDLPYTLARGPLDPTEVALPMGGMFRYMADAALFEECHTGRSYPVAMEEAYLEAERAYLTLEGRGPGEPVFAVLEGRIAERTPMEGPDRPHLVIERFDRFAPGESCARETVAPTLLNTIWRLESLAGTPLEATDAGREPHLVLLGGERPFFFATAGCNSLRGGYEAENATGGAGGLSFGPAASTMMACPPPLDADEARLGTVLQETAGVRVEGDTLTLTDADGAPIARARAVYLP